MLTKQHSFANPSMRMLLIALAVTIVPHLIRQPAWISVVCLILLVWRGLYEYNWVPLPSKLIRLSLAFILIYAIIMRYNVIVGRDAGAAMLLVLLGMKLLETHTHRDQMFALFLGYFIVVISFLFSQSVLVGIYMVIATLLLTAALIAMHHEQRQLSAQYMYLKLAFKLLAQAMPMAILLFFLFPRIPGPLWGLPEDSTRAQTGLSNNMSPGDINQLSDSNAVAFRVQFYTPPPKQTARYWRGPVLWHFDGRRWSNPDALQPWIGGLAQPNNNVVLNDYSITLEPHNKNWLFSLGLPAKIPAGSYLSRDLQLISRKSIKKITRYDMSSKVNYQNIQMDSNRLALYLELPHGIAPRAQALAQTLRSRAQNDADVAILALQHIVTQPFYYTREPPLLFDDPVDEFLFETQRGFCEHYASAFVVLMRAAGIPARVVTGYQGGEMNPLDDYMIVRQADAHAWTEIWLPQQGWTRIDPTAVIPPERIEQTPDRIRRQPLTKLSLTQLNWLKKAWRQSEFAWDALNHHWTQWIVRYNRSQQRNFFKALGMPNITIEGILMILFIGLALILLIIAGFVFHRAKEKQDPILVAYLSFCNKLSKKGFTRYLHEGPLDYATRVSSSHPAWSKSITAITQCYIALRYKPSGSTYTLLILKNTIRKFIP